MYTCVAWVPHGTVGFTLHTPWWMKIDRAGEGGAFAAYVLAALPTADLDAARLAILRAHHGELNMCDLQWVACTVVRDTAWPFTKENTRSSWMRWPEWVVVYNSGDRRRVSEGEIEGVFYLECDSRATVRCTGSVVRAKIHTPPHAVAWPLAATLAPNERVLCANEDHVAVSGGYAHTNGTFTVDRAVFAISRTDPRDKTERNASIGGV